jgi:hypothetical protein
MNSTRHILYENILKHLLLGEFIVHTFSSKHIIRKQKSLINWKEVYEKL